jgi:hypothetical protein
LRRDLVISNQVVGPEAGAKGHGLDTINFLDVAETELVRILRETYSP